MNSNPVLGDLNCQFLEVGFGGEGKYKNVDAAQFLLNRGSVKLGKISLQLFKQVFEVSRLGAVKVPLFKVGLRNHDPTFAFLQLGDSVKQVIMHSPSFVLILLVQQCLL